MTAWLDPGLSHPLGALLEWFLRVSSSLQVSPDDVPPPVRDAIDAAPRPDSPMGAAIYGVSALGVGGGKKLLNRVRGGRTKSPSGTAVSRSGGTPESVKHDDTAFTLPGVLPVSKGIRTVTHNEIHALELGVVVGAVTAWLYSIGRTKIAGTIVVVFVAGGLGFRRYKTKALATVRMEPWYAFVAFAIGAGLAYAYFVGVPVK